MQVFGLCTQNSPQQITQYLKAKLLVGKLAYVLIYSFGQVVLYSIKTFKLRTSVEWKGFPPIKG